MQDFIKKIEFISNKDESEKLLKECFVPSTSENDIHIVSEDYEELLEKGKYAEIFVSEAEGGKACLKAMQEIIDSIGSIDARVGIVFRFNYSFDESIFFLSDFYKRIIYDDYDVLVLEDINQVLHKNVEEGVLNPINKFLSVTDGLVSKYKKIIITTNIESRHQLAPALLRPGRCFDALAFRKLEGEEIEALSKSYEKELETKVEEINLSEFYAKMGDERNTKLLSHQVGF